MSLREIETMDGVGIIRKEDGSEVCRRPYHLTMYEQMHDGGPGQPKIPGMRQIEGRISLQGIEGLTLQGKQLTLQLEDGRSLPFFFSDSGSRIAASGSMK